MEEEKKAEGEKTEEKNAEDVKVAAKKPPVITRSMMEPSESCETCGAAAEPEIPKVLPDASWSTERLVEASKDKNMLTRSMLSCSLGSAVLLNPWSL